MGLYHDLARPIEHLGTSDHVTAGELRNCISRIALEMEKSAPPVAQPAYTVESKKLFDPAPYEPDSLAGNVAKPDSGPIDEMPSDNHPTIQDE